MTHEADSRLVSILQGAYSGERAAGHAYNGHWRSVRDPDERREIRKIELEEWQHRGVVGEMLAELGATPLQWREIVFLMIGTVLKYGCFVSGWMMPMFGAGRLESRNIVEYEDAARVAWRSGRTAWVECLLGMAEVEWDHELYFRARLEQHRFWRRMPLWQKPPPRASIRESFAAETAETAQTATTPDQVPVDRVSEVA